ncbi:MAG: polyprenyl diphosphate synthase [bacterium]
MQDIKHLALIMDGNRRWAKERGKPSAMGHFEGYKRFLEIGELCRQKGIKYLTIYAFSTENWKRSKEEVDALMNLLRLGLEKETDNLHQKNICVKIIGRKADLSADLKKAIVNLEEKTKNNTGSYLNIAISYGGRAEIVDAVKSIMGQGILAEAVTEQMISDHLYTAGQPDPDVIVRCGNQQRLSNFLLYQVAYSELYFTEKYWPDFDEAELDKVIDFYHQTKRNLGK